MDHALWQATQEPVFALCQDNGRGFIKYSKVDLTQCTLVYTGDTAWRATGSQWQLDPLWQWDLCRGRPDQGGNIQVSYSDVQGDFGGQGNIDADPFL